MTLAIASCSSAGAGSDPPALEDADPDALTWVAPSTDAAAAPRAGDTVDLVVATQNAAATVVHFTLDGVELGVCDPADPLEQSPAAVDHSDDEIVDDALESLPSGGCHADDLWRVTTTLPAAGTHTLGAWFVGVNGSRVTAATLTLALGAADTGGGTTTRGADPVSDNDVLASMPNGPTSTVGQSIVDDGAYFDPDSDWHAAFRGARPWSEVAQRVIFRSGALEGSTVAVARCERTFGTYIARYADLNDVSHATVVAAAIAESNCTRGPGGPLRVPVSACVALNPRLTRARCAQSMRDADDFAIQTGVLRLAAIARIGQHDPPRTAAAFRTGGVYRSHRDAWQMRAPRGYIDAFVRAYNAHRTWEMRGARANSYQNPLLPPTHCPDPASLRTTDGAGRPTYYVYCTSCYTTTCTAQSCESSCSPEELAHPYAIWRSHDLLNWDQVGSLFDSRPANYGQMWAPDVHAVNGHYVAYYAATDGASHFIERMVAPRPEGPWTDRHRVVDAGDPRMDCRAVPGTAQGYIDPNVLVTPEGVYLYYAIQSKPICVIRLNDDGTDIYPGSTTRLALPLSDGWEAGTVEGPWVVYNPHDTVNPYYMFYSGNDYRTLYAVGVARAPHPTGPFVKLGTPILTGGHGTIDATESPSCDADERRVDALSDLFPWYAPGHNSIVSDTRGHDFIVYHAIGSVYAQHQCHPEAHRWTMMDPLEWDATTGWPRLVNGSSPSTGTVTLP